MNIIEKDFVLIDSDFYKKSKWENLIIENEGYYREDDQLMVFRNNDSEVCIFYTLTLSGEYKINKENFELHISNIKTSYEVDITYISIDGVEYKQTDNESVLLTQLIKNNL